MPKTTKKQFEFFKKRSKHWQEVLGLKGWDIECEHTALDPLNYAECNLDIMARTVCIRLNTEWPELATLAGSVAPTEKALDVAALHEVLHVLLGRLELMAQWRFVRSGDVFTEEAHAIIRTLENVLILEA